MGERFGGLVVAVVKDEVEASAGCVGGSGSAMALCMLECMLIDGEEEEEEGRKGDEK